jgi:hypothetical protein
MSTHRIIPRNICGSRKVKVWCSKILALFAIEFVRGSASFGPGFTCLYEIWQQIIPTPARVTESSPTIIVSGNAPRYHSISKEGPVRILSRLVAYLIQFMALIVLPPPTIFAQITVSLRLFNALRGSVVKAQAYGKGDQAPGM